MVFKGIIAIGVTDTIIVDGELVVVVGLELIEQVKILSEIWIPLEPKFVLNVKRAALVAVSMNKPVKAAVVAAYIGFVI